MARRTLLGTKAGFSERTRVYLAGDAIEVDDIEGYSGTRRRVLLDEVRVVTLDRRRSAAFLWIVGLLTLVFFFSIVLNFSEEGRFAVIFAALFCVPLLAWFAFHAALGIDHVTVFGKRSNAVMAFALNKGKARRTFMLLRDRATLAQDEARARLAAEAEQAVEAVEAPPSAP
jgi:hypothetical protein